MSLIRACDSCGDQNSVNRYYLTTNVKTGKNYKTTAVKQGDLCAACLAKLPLLDKDKQAVAA